MRFVMMDARGGPQLGMLDGDHVLVFAPLATLASRAARGKARRAAAEIPNDLLSFVERGSLVQAKAALAVGRRLLAAGKARGVAVPASKARLVAPIPRPRKNIFCMGRNYAEHAKESGRNIPVERALDYVFGYTIMNDVTARDLQRRHEQWFKGKSLDTFAPMGPAVVHRSAIPDPQNVILRLRVNGEERQHASTRSMVFSVAQIIAALS